MECDRSVPPTLQILASGGAFCGTMVSFGKPVAEPSSDAIQAKAGPWPSAPPYSTSLRAVSRYVLALMSMQSHSGWRFSTRNISACEGRFS